MDECVIKQIEQNVNRRVLSGGFMGAHCRILSTFCIFEKIYDKTWREELKTT